MNGGWCKFIATMSYVGYLPIAPGTLGSLLALLVYFFIKSNPWVMAFAIFLSIILGLLTAGRAEKLFGGKDASEIIIDEFTGMLISVFLLPGRFGYIVAAFLLFRLFDIVKPKPIDILERLNGGVGVMADDIMAGLYTNLILHGVLLFKGMFR